MLVYNNSLFETSSTTRAAVKDTELCKSSMSACNIDQLTLSRGEFSRNSCRRLRKDLQPKDLDYIVVLVRDFIVNAHDILVSILLTT